MAQPVKRRVRQVQIRQGFSLCECDIRGFNQKSAKFHLLGMAGGFVNLAGTGLASPDQGRPLDAGRDRLRAAWQGAGLEIAPEPAATLEI